MTYLQLKFLNSLGHSKNFFLQSCLISLEVAQLLVKTLGLSILIAIMSINFFGYAMELVCKSLSSVLTLHGQYTLQSFLLWSQDLNFLFVNIKVFSKLSQSFIKIWKLAFQVSSVVSSSLHIHTNNGHSCLLESVALLKRDYNNNFVRIKCHADWINDQICFIDIQMNHLPFECKP